MAQAYTCAQCGTPVARSRDGSFVRKCGHNDAGVAAWMSATAYGEGGPNGSIGGERAIDRLISALRARWQKATGR